MTESLENLIPEESIALYGEEMVKDQALPRVSLELPRFEIDAIYRHLLGQWVRAAQDPFRRAWLSYFEARLAYVRQFMDPFVVDMIEAEYPPEVRLLHDEIIF